eukprot:899938_1
MHMGDMANSKLKEMVNSCKLKLKSKRRKKKTRSHPNDDFIIEYAHNSQSEDHPFDINSLDKRRFVFVSLMGLYLTWKQCPTPILYSSIFILPLQREWIYNPLRYKSDIELHFQLSLFSDITERETFMELLKWKDSQGLCVWMLDELDNEPQCDTSLVHPIWNHVNRTLMNLYDPVTGHKYNGIHLNEDWWQNDKEYVSKYDVEPVTIVSELYFVALKFKAIQEIIYQSNPNSLLPVRSYQGNVKLRSVEMNLYDEIDGDDIDEWWISPEYDPEDM